jgi:2-phosphoglycerate kinase
MQAISQGLGSGAVSEVELCDVLAEDWAEFMTVDLRLKLSDEFAALVDSDFHCPQGICKTSLPLLNEEFNMFRGLFPLKVFIGGPPAVGKSHFSAKLASSYGIPHLTIAEMIEHAKKEKSVLGDRVRANLE